VSMLSQNRALTRIFGSKRKEVTEERSKMHNEALHDFSLLNTSYSSVHIKEDELRLR
jgi:hypothetical protein